MPASRTLILLAKKPAEDLQARIASQEEPRAEYLELKRALGAELVDFHDVEKSEHPVVRNFHRRLGPLWGLAALGAVRHREFDHLYATGEDVGIPLVMMLKGLRVREKLTVVMHNVGTPKRRVLLRVLGHSAYRNVIVLGTSQRDILLNVARLPPEKVHRFDQWLDPEFFRPPSQPVPDGGYALSIGMEQRDYPTLQAAVEGTPYRFHVVASGWSPGAGYGAARGISAASNIEVGRGYSTQKLRSLYAAARFVVVPLKSVTYAAGVTGIVEGMAMGKAIIASASPGILDYVRDGVSGRLVPVGDPEAMRRAIAELWEQPELCARMGAHNRQWIEREINTQRYVEKVVRLLS
ncbi:MAG: glycosyltransferase [Myxococcaceae bacterium]|nr:glycosyltransferase [Myxococcaceae bacterium]